MKKMVNSPSTNPSTEQLSVNQRGVRRRRAPPPGRRRKGVYSNVFVRFFRVFGELLGCKTHSIDKDKKTHDFCGVFGILGNDYHHYKEEINDSKEDIY